MIGLDASLARTGMNMDTSLKKLSLLVLSWSQLKAHSLPPGRREALAARTSLGL